MRSSRRLAQGEMHIYDSGGVKLHAYQTGDPLADEVFLVEKAPCVCMIQRQKLFEKYAQFCGIVT